jgi:SAM-dependent methyltransferase
LQTDIYNFWKNHSLANIKPQTGEEYPEGWDVVEFFKNFRKYGNIIEVGCGYGRLCRAFDSEHYLGIDISYDAVRQARKMFPNYKFDHIIEQEVDHMYRYSDTKLLYTVLLHQSDEDIESIIEKLCQSSKTIIVAEVTGRDWRRKGNPPVFNREVSEYEVLFTNHGRGLTQVIKKPYERYKDWDKNNTDLTVMVFED